MTFGTVLRSHAGGYLVFEPQLDSILLCQARKRLKKERITILTGDRVILEDLDPSAATAVITGCRKRASLLSRPPIANVDQVIIVQALKQPEWNQLWCDRYIVHFQLELPGCKPVLCFNKCDLVETSDCLSLSRLYENLGYRVIFISATRGIGVDELVSILPGRISVFAGPSGVGKSSILNAIEPELNLKIGVMDHDFGVGRHTTTYSRIYRINRFKDAPSQAWVADTPGFNLLELRHPEPSSVMWQFPEIVELRADCRFADCMHLVEDGCRVIEALDLDSQSTGEEPIEEDSDISSNRSHNQSNVSESGQRSISATRYESYITLLNEAKEMHEQQRATSTKLEQGVKKVGGPGGRAKHIPLLNTKYRQTSRRSMKQQLNLQSLTDEDTEEESPEQDEFHAKPLN